MSVSTLLIAAVIIIAVLIIIASYVKAPPSVAFIVSGINRKPRILIGPVVPEQEF